MTVRMKDIYNSLKIFILKRLYTDFQVYLYESCRVINRNKTGSWYWKNFGIPLLFILTPFFFRLFVSDVKILLDDILLNGSLTVLGFSVLFSTSSYLIRSTSKGKISRTDYKRKIRIYDELDNMRDKSLNYLWVLALTGFVLYIIQILGQEHLRLVNTSWLFVLIIFTLIASIVFAHLIFNISDDFVDKTMEWDYLFKRLEEDEKETDQLMQKVDKLLG